MILKATGVALMLTLGFAAAPASGTQAQRPVQMLPLPGIAPTPTPAPLMPPINPGPAVVPPAGISPILTEPGPLFPPPKPASPSYPLPSLPGPIDQQKLRAYHNELQDRRWKLDRSDINPGREIQLLNPPAATAAPYYR